VNSEDRASRIFADALEQDEGERSRFIESECDGDEELLAEVNSWLASYAESADFIEQPAVSGENRDILIDHSGEQLGNYKLLRQIGLGGMGAVYLAERSDGEFEQQVALKIVRQTFADTHTIERFRRERQILAGLDHPNIARLLDGGVSGNGQPFVVMEYVDGEPLQDHAEHQKLNIDDRLRLFSRICSAVAHAHRNLVIHRDIKPANILVTKGGEPKLLDFGVAKLLDDDASQQTATMFRALTPAYASPEQLRGAAVSTATDIYSLGLVLYELLTNARPFDFDGKTLAQMIETAENSSPLLPSLRTTEPSIRSRLHGDIDTIILTALAKEPERRYASVEALVEDIDRHLNGLPINARPSTFGYRASKFITRHKAAVTAAAGVVVILLAAVFVSLWQARTAARERDIAQLERKRAEQVTEFLRTILSAASPTEKGRDAKVIEILDDTAAKIDTEFAEPTALKAQVLDIVGSTYLDLGLPDRAEGFTRRSVEIYRSVNGDRDRSTAYSEINLGGILLNLGKNADAAILIEKGIATLREVETGDSPQLARGLFILGELYVRTDRAAEAVPLLNESIEMFDRILGVNNSESAYSYTTLGRALDRTNDLAGAELALKRSLAIYRSLGGNYKYREAFASFNLGEIMLKNSRTDEALATFAEAMPAFEAMGDSWEQFIGITYFSKAYFQKRDYAATIRYAGKAVAMADRLRLEKMFDYRTALNHLGLSLTRTGRAAAAEPYLRRFYELTFADHPEGSVQRAYAQGSLGECLTALGKYAEAQPLLTSSHETIRNTLGDSNATTAIAVERLNELARRRR